MMTSNLASDEIAGHALQLRREAERAAQEYRKGGRGERGEEEEQRVMFIVLVSPSAEQEEQIEISREFKEQVVEPILKVCCSQLSSI